MPHICLYAPPHPLSARSSRRCPPTSCHPPPHCSRYRRPSRDRCRMYRSSAGIATAQNRAENNYCPLPFGVHRFRQAPHRSMLLSYISPPCYFLVFLFFYFLVLYMNCVVGSLSILFFSKQRDEIPLLSRVTPPPVWPLAPSSRADERGGCEYWP